MKSLQRLWCLCLVGMPIGALAAEPANPVAYRVLESIHPEDINKKLKPGLPAVDVAIYLCETKENPHGYVASPDDLAASFKRAKSIFAAADMQLKLLWVKRAIVPAAWLTLHANKIEGPPPPTTLNPYVGYRLTQRSLTDKAKTVFEGIIEKQPENHRTIYLLYLKEVRMAFHDRSREPARIKTIPTGGLSLPGYMFGKRIPRRIRGAITLCRQKGPGGRTIAHELGHKLINVSHEYRKISPQFEVRGEGGLMIYGRGTEIPAGKEGRWHRERLHLSPFIYRIGEDRKRRWNPDYREGGHYYDPIYGDKVVRFGKMEAPATKSKPAK